MSSICGIDCCKECDKKGGCGGCTDTNGHPFGGQCVAAECIKQGGMEAFSGLKRSFINEFNALGIKDLYIDDLHLLNGSYINLEYPLPGGQTVKFLDDNNVYWGNQVEIPGSDRCYGLAAGTDFLLVCEYGCNGTDPEIVLFQSLQPGRPRA